MTASFTGLDAMVRHLLRNLNDPGALRGNGLVTRRFGPTPDATADNLVAAGIRRTIELLGECLEHEAKRNPHQAESLQRQQRILEQCDLAGRAHKVVAAELGVERRQFYRERGRLRRRVAQWLASQDEVQAVIVVDRFATALAYLNSLRSGGTNDRLLRDGATMLADVYGERRVEIGNLLIEVYGECGDIRRADQLADLLWAESTSSDTLRNTWGRAHVEHLRGRIPVAAKALYQIIEHCARVPVGQDESIDEFRARAILEFAQCMHMMGDFEAARQSWQSVGDMLAGTTLTPATRVQTLWQLGAAAMTRSGWPDEASPLFNLALSEALHQNLPREAADALIASANVHLKRDELDRALEDARNALALAQRVFGENEFSWRALSVASVELTAGYPARAIDLVHEASVARGSNPLRDGYGEWLESSALLALGKAQDALPVSFQAVADLRTAGNQRHLGASLRIYAEAAARTHHKREAIAAIEEAVELLSHYGLPNARANAIRSRAAIREA